MVQAEQFATPVEGELGAPFLRRNEFGDQFLLRWGKIVFQLRDDTRINIKVILHVLRSSGVTERFFVDTDPSFPTQRVTRDFFVCVEATALGHIAGLRFSYIVHRAETSIPSRCDYSLCNALDPDHYGPIPRLWPLSPVGENAYRTSELDPELLQRDALWHSRHLESLGVMPKFTRGVVNHPYHPKRYIHDRIDEMIARRKQNDERSSAIKVCVDCIDDRDFINHLLYAQSMGVTIQCVVDWRKMTLTRSDNYTRLKQSGAELLGVFCSSRDPRVELPPDMHLKFILFGDEDSIVGSFNITFDRWWANWESGLTFHSFGVSRLLDNIFQSVRGGAIQRYVVEPFGAFNLLYTFGRHYANGRLYRPQHAIFSVIHRARSSIRGCLFHLSEMQGDYNDSVIDALIAAKGRGVDVQLILNGHVVREGDPRCEYSMGEELKRSLIPAVERLRRGGIPVHLAYGVNDHRVPYCPLHAKYCVVDQETVLEGSFNWYNTSVFSHDILAVLADRKVAEAYTNEFYYTRACLRFPCERSLDTAVVST